MYCIRDAKVRRNLTGLTLGSSTIDPEACLVDGDGNESRHVRSTLRAGAVKAAAVQRAKSLGSRGRSAEMSHQYR